MIHIYRFLLICVLGLALMGLTRHAVAQDDEPFAPQLLVLLRHFEKIGDREKSVNEIAQYDPVTGRSEVMTTLPSQVRYLAWSPDGQYVGLLEDASLYVYEVATGLNAMIRTDPTINMLEWSSDSRYMMFAINGDLVYYDVTTRDTASITYDLDEKVQWFSLSPDGRSVGYIASDTSLPLTSIGIVEFPNVVLKTVPVRMDQQLAPQWTPDGQAWIVWIDGTLTLLNLADMTTQPLSMCALGETFIDVTLAWHPDGRLTCSLYSYEDGTMYQEIRLGDVRSGEFIVIDEQVGMRVYLLSWSPDGTQLLMVTPRGDYMINSYDAETRHLSSEVTFKASSAMWLPR